MKITIQRTQYIPPHILTQVKQFSPREGLKAELGNPEPKDARVKCAWENYAGYILDDGKLVSFAILAQDQNFNKNIAEALGLDASKTAVIIYLFTLPEYQKQGHAKTIIDGLAEYAKANFLCKKLIRTTSSEANKNLYNEYGANLEIPKNTNTFLEQEDLINQYFFVYSL